eukprot:11144296-Alexandrium_andersonii.AAC.1
MEARMPGDREKKVPSRPCAVSPDRVLLRPHPNGKSDVAIGPQRARWKGSRRHRLGRAGKGLRGRRRRRGVGA